MSVTWRILEGDCRDTLRSLPAGSVHTCVTSPPYFGLRDYGTGEWDGGDDSCDHIRPKTTYNDGFNARWGNAEGQKKQETKNEAQFALECGKCGARRVDRQIGLEPTPGEFVAALVAVFREVRRVLRDDGTVWLNLGDSYVANGRYDAAYEDKRPRPAMNGGARQIAKHGETPRKGYWGEGVKPKDLVGIPWMVAFALRADGWYLRSDIIWSKPNPMPESVTDRPTKAHEYVFLLSKGPRYFYDADAIRESLTCDNGDSAGARGEGDARALSAVETGRTDGFTKPPRNAANPNGRNKRSVWTVATQPYAGAHFATFPPKLIEPCILAGAPERACGECGAPWVRVVEHVPAPGAEMRPKDARKFLGASRTSTLGTSNSHDGTVRNGTNRTLGFEPSCSHGDGSASGVVLDPFAGAGTTGMVALRHSRSFVGIELAPTYAAMARLRIVDDQPLFNQASEVAA